MKVYVAIGHFKDSDNVTCIALAHTTKASFMSDCYGNAFVPYVVITEKILTKLFDENTGSYEIFEQVRKLTSNFRVWEVVADYIGQCDDIIKERVAEARNTQ